MATFQKRGKAWRAIVRRNGKSKSATFDTKAEAEQWATRLEAKILDGADDPVEAVEQVKEEDTAAATTVADLFERYVLEVSPTKRGCRWEEYRIRALARDFPKHFDKPALRFTGPDLAEWRDERLRQVSAATVSRELNMVSSVFTHAIREWRTGITVNPCSLISKPRKPKSRTQRVPKTAEARLIAHLGWDGVSQPETSPQWAAYAFSLALKTAMRKGEILKLRWADISFEERYAALDITKNGESRHVPLSRAALDHLRLIRRGAPNEKVVPIYSGNLDKHFRKARIETGLKAVRFHDARREATTNMAARLSNVLELAQITGHKTLSMLAVYYKPKPADLADKLDAF